MSAIVPCLAQRNFGAGGAVFEYCQLKRNAAKELLNKKPPAPKDLEWAIILQKELLIYLDTPEVRLLSETDQSLKSQRADVRFDLALSLVTTGRKKEALRTLSELADEAGSPVYADWLNQEPFVGLRDEPEFQNVIARLRSIKNYWRSTAFQIPLQPDLTEDQKIAGLSLFWSNAKHNFVYFDQIPQLDWDQVYLDYLPRVRQTKSTYEYYRVLQELCALLKDGHTNVFLPPALREELEARPPFRAALVEDKVVVWRVLSETLKRQAIQTGMEIVSIDGLPVRDYAKRFVAPYQSSSTAQDLAVRTYTYALLAGPKDRPIEMEFKRPNGESFKRSVQRSGYTDVQPAAPPVSFTVLEHNVGYLAINNFESEKVVTGFVENLDSLARTDALIIDLRENNGGNSGFGYDILSYVTDKPFQSSRWSTRQTRALRRGSGVDIEWFGENSATLKANGQKLYAKPIVVLTSPRTFSAAEDFLVAFDYMKRGKIIGEATAGSTGQPLFFTLPGSGGARICSKRDFYPDGRKFVGVGILPDIPISLRVSDLVDGKDSVLMAALQELKSQTK